MLSTSSSETIEFEIASEQEKKPLVVKSNPNLKIIFRELVSNASLPTVARFFAVGSDFFMAYYLSKLGKNGLVASSLINPYTSLLKTILASSMFAVSLDTRSKLKKGESVASSLHAGLTVAIIETLPSSIINS